MKYKVTASGRFQGVAYIEAASPDDEKFRALRSDDFEWVAVPDTFSVSGIEQNQTTHAPSDSAEAEPEQGSQPAVSSESPPPDPEPEVADQDPPFEVDELEEEEVEEVAQKKPKSKTHKKKR